MGKADNKLGILGWQFPSNVPTSKFTTCCFENYSDKIGTQGFYAVQNLQLA